MSADASDRAGPAAPDPGLCRACAHVRIVRTRRGSRFHLCERSREDASYPRYPRLPVLECAGFEHRIDPVDDTPSAEAR